ncbi:uncharacterized protein LOC124404754 isoform X2 [Diprion similis]|uniref:uncharacterized protein LOC124404754 isoform X2 n=1 Tax=Diprion similis TaxID=362088 RepID=UPI001EF843E1|nr:uncharacterized protein LOC124404754 isoform X2 [Diprion similis]
MRRKLCNNQSAERRATFICVRSKGERKRIVELIDFFNGSDDEWIAIFEPELVESLQWVSLLVINLISHGFTADQKKQDFTKTLPRPNSLMDKMMKKYSYPKSEVTAGVGYGHHLHPLYYQGEKEMMYPCAVECGEWEAMDSGESINEASSNVDMVTTHPDVSAIDITTPKSRAYKDISYLRPKKYNSASSSAASSATDSASSRPDIYNDFGIHDSKGAGIQILPQKVNSGYNGGDAEDTKIPNDGSLYERYRDSLLSRFNSGLPDIGNEGSKENEQYYNPMAESMGYNPPSFDDADDEDVRAGRTYRPKDHNDFHPKREMIEEKYVKHDVREERLEDVRTNSFGVPGGGEDYSTDSNPGLWKPTKYVDDYAAPQTHKGNLEQERKRHPYRGGYLRSNYLNYGTNRKPIYGHKQTQKKNPTVGRRPSSYGRYRKYPLASSTGRSLGSGPQKTYHDSYQRRPNSYHPYSSIPVYSARGRFGSGGIQVVQPPQRLPTYLKQQKRYPDHKVKGFSNSPYTVGHRITYKRHIPQENGFTKIIKRYKSVVNHMPKKYVVSGEPYQGR